MALRLNDVDGQHRQTGRKPRVAIIGAGSRGNAYARAVLDSGIGTVAAIVEPIDLKRKQFGLTYIWHDREPSQDQEFPDWKDFVAFLETPPQRDANRIDGVFVCVRDDMHVHVVSALAPLGLHIMCEKPLATSLEDCLRMQRTLRSYPQRIFAIGHVLRYSPHNMLLRHLVLEQQSIGEVLSMEHTEPVGWWHFSHSYVRGQWRKESTSAPSLLTKSCHDIDFILWLLCSPFNPERAPHLPSHITSLGSLKQFVRKRKPKAAGSATNCLQCPISETCIYSAPRIYYDRQLRPGKTKWPIDVVNPGLPSIFKRDGPEKAKEALFNTLAQDYDKASTSVQDIESRPWYGRCVWESDNDVCDDQVVTFSWSDDYDLNYTAKTATFHMIAQTIAQCERRGRIYGTDGEIEYDSRTIIVSKFNPSEPSSADVRVYKSEIPKNSHHGGGDDGLTTQFLKSISAVEEGRMCVNEAQTKFLGVTLDDIIRSHAAVFAAEEARRDGKVVNWLDWWDRNITKAN